MQNFHSRTQLVFTPAFCVSSALMFLIFPLKLVLSWFIAALIHEICHYSMLAFFKIPVYSVIVGMDGALMNTGPMRYKEEFLCSISGPIGGLLTLFFVRQFPLIALCSIMQSIYNLLPIYPLDGGRAVRCLLVGLIKEPLGSNIHRGIETVTIILMCVACFAATFIWNFGCIPLIAAMILFFKSKTVKTACKQRLQRVQ